MSSLADRTLDRLPVNGVDGHDCDFDFTFPEDQDGQRKYRSQLPDGASDVQRRWDRLARQGRWMIAVYRDGNAANVKVVRVRRAHLNDCAKVRIEVEVGQIVRVSDAEVAAVDDHRILDVPVDRILWYEIIDDIGRDDVPLFHAATAKGLQACREIADGEPLTSADAAWSRPR